MNKVIDFIIMPKGYGRASKEVRDYIVNLRQENKRLEENNKAMQEEMARTWEENERLTNNWNELEEWLKEDNINVYCCSKSSQKAFKGAKAIYKLIILSKMKEIQNGSDKE